MKHFIQGMFNFWRFLFTGRMDYYVPTDDRDFELFIWGGRTGAIVLLLVVLVPTIALLLYYA